MSQDVQRPPASTLRSDPRPASLLLDREPEIHQVLDEIAKALWNHRFKLDHSLASGLPGAAVFLGHLSRLPGAEMWEERSRELLDLAIRQLGRGLAPSLYGGYVGVAWAIEHLTREVFGSSGEDPNEDVDALLLEVLGRVDWVRHFDLVSGLTGIGVYALERWQRPSARRVLERVLVHLEGMATPVNSHKAWPTRAQLLTPWAREQSPQGHYDLGVAHGVPGVLALLAGIHAVGVGGGLALELHATGMDWLRSILQDPACGSYLGGWLPLHLEEVPPGATRVGWCYGDLGASVSLLWAARLVGRVQDETLALDLGRLAAGRAVGESGVVDVSLCHGSAGNAHLFHRLRLATGEVGFGLAAQAYLHDVLDRRRPGEGFAGFFHYAPDGNGLEWDPAPAKANKPYPGLLEGAAGVGLALLAALGAAEPTWDRFLLASPPAGLLPMPSAGLPGAASEGQG